MIPVILVSSKLADAGLSIPARNPILNHYCFVLTPDDITLQSPILLGLPNLPSKDSVAGDTTDAGILRLLRPLSQLLLDLCTVCSSQNIVRVVTCFGDDGVQDRVRRHVLIALPAGSDYPLVSHISTL